MFGKATVTFRDEDRSNSNFSLDFLNCKLERSQGWLHIADEYGGYKLYPADAIVEVQWWPNHQDRR